MPAVFEMPGQANLHGHRGCVDLEGQANPRFVARPVRGLTVLDLVGVERVGPRPREAEGEGSVTRPEVECDLAHASRAQEECANREDQREADGSHREALRARESSGGATWSSHARAAPSSYSRLPPRQDGVR